MGKKKHNGEYNDFLDGEKLRDNGHIRTTLNDTSPSSNAISPPPTRQNRAGKEHGKRNGAPKKPPLTHFLCLPLVTDDARPHIQVGLEKLKEDISKHTNVPPKAIRPLGTLHLTLGVMSLDTEQKLENAIQCLRELNLHALLRDISLLQVAEQAALDGTISENFSAAALPDADGLTVDLRALAAMQKPEKTSVLYAEPVDGTQRLGVFAEKVRGEFVREEWVVEEGRELRLHATVVNTVYAKSKGRGRNGDGKSKELQAPKPNPDSKQDDDTGSDDAPASNPSKNSGHGPNGNPWVRFDARTLIDAYKDFTWAKDVGIDRVQICKMGAKKVWSGGREGEGEVVDEMYEVVAEKGIFE
jgi:activating signal cointegrator complex subunit 1